ncbi:hypothetical protein T4B_12 [Trichinella pseudospiralis]|uniref:Uncharacterized protein n=1 Tax=Trichinella pseudospiralis TaxID=6337 RepID=A0A0V1J8V4_TRIPS|nr:hypothetical protein T4C_10858 [Trichinella pseudospiralis]KRZ31402.1 hypothetical protein T4B_12 [Trichinella pseudospiralis]
MLNSECVDCIVKAERFLLHLASVELINLQLDVIYYDYFDNCGSPKIPDSYKIGRFEKEVVN